VHTLNIDFNLQLKNKLIQLYKSKRIPHALLLNGKEGCGHFQLGFFLANLLLCQKANEQPCGSCPSCRKFLAFQHPDIHFSFPIHISKAINTEISDDKRSEFISFVKKYKTIGKNTWNATLGNESKQSVIGVKESQSINKKLLLTSYEGGPKVLFMWLAESMNLQASNKLLKLIEEPPERTFFIFITNQKEQLLPTIKSRLQCIDIPSPKNPEIVNFLEKEFNLKREDAVKYADTSNRNLHAAVNNYLNSSENISQLPIFIKWMRLCYTRNISDNIDWANEFSKVGREGVQIFLIYSLEIFRNCIVGHYNESINDLKEDEQEFLNKFKPFVNNNNIVQITALIEEACLHIERNANLKILLLDISIKLYQLLKINKQNKE